MVYTDFYFIKGEKEESNHLTYEEYQSMRTHDWKSLPELSYEEFLKKQIEIKEGQLSIKKVIIDTDIEIEIRKRIEEQPEFIKWCSNKEKK